jgi:hypothetical protein
MRFMVLLKGDPVGEHPSPELVDAMITYNEELVKAGILLAAEGLFDSTKGARVVTSGGRKTVIDGPFTEAKELIAGFYLIQVRSKEEAIEWAKRCPVEVAIAGTDREAVVEIRQVAEAEEIPTMTDEQVAAERRIREQIQGG